MTNIQTRLKVYAADGDEKGYLHDPADWSASLPSNDTSALTLSYPVSGRGANLLNDYVEVALEVNVDNKWVEPPNARYRLMERSYDPTDGKVGILKLTLPGYAGIMEGIRVLSRNYVDARYFDSKGKRRFKSATPGAILTSLFNEARKLVPDVAPKLVLKFTATRDSLGNPWERINSISYEPGLSMMTVLQNLSDQGQCDWHMEGRTLHVGNPNSFAEITKHRVGEFSEETPIRATIAGLRHTVLLVGESQTWRKDNPGAVRPWGSTITVIKQGGVTNGVTASSLIEHDLQSGQQERVEYTTTIPFIGRSPSLFNDYRVGDYVQFRNNRGKWEQMRVCQATLSGGASGEKLILTLNDRFIDEQVRAARRRKGIANGASGDAGAGTIPEPPKPSHPAKPVGLVVDSEGYWEGSTPRSLIKVGWSPVETDVYGAAMSVDHYEVKATGNKWDNVKEKPESSFSGYPPGTLVNVWVRACSFDNTYSEWSDGVSITTKAPESTVDQPTPFKLHNAEGVISVEWDGKVQHTETTTPYTPPAYFSHVVVQEAQSYGGPWTDVGSMSLASRSVVVAHGDDLGKTLFYRGIAYSQLLKPSTPSPARSIAVSSAIRAEVDKAQKEARQAADAAGVADGKAGKAVVVAGNANRIIRRPSWRGTPKDRDDRTPLVEGDLLFSTNATDQVVSVQIYTGAANGWQKQVLVAGEIVVPGSVNTVHINDGAITAGKITASQALVDKLVTREFMAGHITTNMFEASAAFKSDKVTVSAAGIVVHGSNNQVVRITADGIEAFPNGKPRTFFIDANNGNVELKGSITSGSTITGSKISGGTINGTFIYGGQFRTDGIDNPSNTNVFISGNAWQGRPAVVFNSGYKGGGQPTATTIGHGADQGGFDQGDFVISGGETSINSSGRADLILKWGGDFQLKQNWGTYVGIGLFKESASVDLKGMSANTNQSQFTSGTGGKGWLNKNQWRETTLTYGAPVKWGMRIPTCTAMSSADAPPATCAINSYDSSGFKMTIGNMSDYGISIRYIYTTIWIKQ